MENDLHRSRRLDALRGVAILAVVTFHYGHGFVAARLPALSPLVNTLWVGVDLFFVLSGFLLGGILLRNREAPWYFSTFYGRRFLRIVPLYAVCVVGFFLLFRSSQSPLPLIFFVQNIQWGIAGIFGSSDRSRPPGRWPSRSSSISCCRCSSSSARRACFRRCCWRSSSRRLRCAQSFTLPAIAMPLTNSCPRGWTRSLLACWSRGPIGNRA